MKKSEKLITAIATIAFGILLVVLRSNFIGILMTVAGIGLIAFGLIDFFSKLIPSAVVKIVVGGLIILCGWVLVEAVLYVLAAILLIAGVLLLYDKIKHEVRCATMFYTVLEYAMPSILIVIGIMLLFQQEGILDAVFVISGILTVIEGGLVLLNAIEND